MKNNSEKCGRYTSVLAYAMNLKGVKHVVAVPLWQTRRFNKTS